MLTGFALAFARALGEYGSVVFISGNMPMRTEIVPLLIMTKLEQFDYRGRHRDRGRDAGGVVRCCCSPSIVLQRWSSRRADGLSGTHQETNSNAANFVEYLNSGGAAESPASRSATADPPIVRALLIAIAMLFLGLFLVVPLVAVFAEALSRRAGARTCQRISDPAGARCHPADAADGGDRGAAQRGLRRGGIVG